MKITIEIDEALEDDIVIRCSKVTEEINRLLKALNEENKILVRDSKEEKLISITSIYRVDTVDDKVFVYTANEVFETSYRVYELDKILPNDRFIRINKSGIINVLKIDKLKTDLNRRIRVTLLNGDKEVVNRTYVTDFKNLLNDIKRRVINEQAL
ncbi:MAG: LytTR family DNA-binding domain-containing protein [Sarcina sp.]